MPCISGEFEIHRYAVLDQRQTSLYVSCTETTLKEFVSKVDTVITGRDIILVPKRQWNGEVDSHRPNLVCSRDQRCSEVIRAQGHCYNLRGIALSRAAFCRLLTFTGLQFGQS
jgi:hypothetical protein